MDGVSHCAVLGRNTTVFSDGKPADLSTNASSVPYSHNGSVQHPEKKKEHSLVKLNKTQDWIPSQLVYG